MEVTPLIRPAVSSALSANETTEPVYVVLFVVIVLRSGEIRVIDPVSVILPSVIISPILNVQRLVDQEMVITPLVAVPLAVTLAIVRVRNVPMTRAVVVSSSFAAISYTPPSRVVAPIL